MIMIMIDRAIMITCIDSPPLLTSVHVICDMGQAVAGIQLSGAQHGEMARVVALSKQLNKKNKRQFSHFHFPKREV